MIGYRTCTIETADVPTLDAYAATLKALGTKIVPGIGGSFWVEGEKLSLVRIPTFDTTPLLPDEIRRVLTGARVGVISYLVEPSESLSPNAFLYLCKDPGYHLDALPSACRRNVRRGLKEMIIAPVTHDELLKHGLPAYADTRKRVGLSDGTAECFGRRFGARIKCSNHTFLGAWKDGALAGFLSITRVERWAEIEGCYSMNSFLQSRPNDVLLYSALSHYLAEGECDVVSYGVSSVQSSPDESGLHAFKMKVGFEAKPVHRVFVPHPLIRPFISQVGLWGIWGLLRLRPNNRRLLKAQGMVSNMLVTQASECS